MQGSARGSNVRYYPTWKHSPLKDKNEQGCYKVKTARCLQLGYESLRHLIADQYEVFRPPACFVILPHCIKDVYTPQGSTRDLWTVLASMPSNESHATGIVSSEQLLPVERYLNLSYCAGPTSWMQYEPVLLNSCNTLHAPVPLNSCNHTDATRICTTEQLQPDGCHTHLHYWTAATMRMLHVPVLLNSCN
jgi:hypothetical protein